MHCDSNIAETVPTCTNIYSAVVLSERTGIMIHAQRRVVLHKPEQSVKLKDGRDTLLLTRDLVGILWEPLSVPVHRKKRLNKSSRHLIVTWWHHILQESINISSAPNSDGMIKIRSVRKRVYMSPKELIDVPSQCGILSNGCFDSDSDWLNIPRYNFNKQ